MDIDFLTADQRYQYGRFTCEPDEVELTGCFHLDNKDIALINTRRGDISLLK